MGMNMNNLKIFIQVADAGNITKAAEALYISQPAVSKAVKNIEDELGVPLFHRDRKNGLSLTDTGERILGFAREMMLMEEKIYQTAYLSRNLLEGTLKIASLPIGSQFFLAEALAVFQKDYPDVNVEIMEGTTHEVNQMVSGHAAEFGISIMPAGDFQYQVLMEDSIVAISREPFEDSSVDLESTRQSFFVCEAALESILPVLEQRGVRRKQQFKVVSAGTVRRMVSCGIGPGLQAASLVAGEDFYQVPVEPLVRTDVILIASDFETLSPAAAAFLGIMLEENRRR